MCSHVSTTRLEVRAFTRWRADPWKWNHALESTITVARNEWKYVAELATDFDPALPPVACLPGPINQCS